MTAFRVVITSRRLALLVKYLPAKPFTVPDAVFEGVAVGRPTPEVAPIDPDTSKIPMVPSSVFIAELISAHTGADTTVPWLVTVPITSRLPAIRVLPVIEAIRVVSEPLYAPTRNMPPAVGVVLVNRIDPAHVVTPVSPGLDIETPPPLVIIN